MSFIKVKFFVLSIVIIVIDFLDKKTRMLRSFVLFSSYIQKLEDLLFVALDLFLLFALILIL